MTVVWSVIVEAPLCRRVAMQTERLPLDSGLRGARGGVRARRRRRRDVRPPRPIRVRIRVSQISGLLMVCIDF